GRDRPFRVDAVGEFPANDLSKTADAIKALLPAGGEIVCSVRPKSRHLRFSAAADAQRYPGVAGARRFAATDSSPDWLACVPVSPATPADVRWLLEIAPDGSQKQIADSLAALGLPSARHFSF